MSSSLALGIQLGGLRARTVAVVDDRLQLVPVDHGEHDLPSVVWLSDRDELVVGREAKRRCRAHADRVRWPLKIDPDVPAALPARLGGRDLAGLAGEILYGLRVSAERRFDRAAESVTVAVPVHLDEVRRQVVDEARTVAGLGHAEVIDEPTAALYTHGLHTCMARRLVLVVDLGAASLDVALLEVGADGVATIAAHSDLSLGADVWHRRVVAWLIACFARRTGVDVSGDRMACQRLEDVALDAKHELSDAPWTTVKAPFLTVDAAGGRLHLEERLNRTRFDAFTHDLRRDCAAVLDRVLDQAGVAPAQLGAVVLLGGGSRIPAVVDLVRRLSPVEPRRGQRPELTAAVGAALHAARRLGTTAPSVSDGWQEVATIDHGGEARR